MKGILATLAAVSALSLSTAAYADDATGTVTAINLANSTVTTDDGKVYVFTAAVDLKQVKIGEKVKITYVQATPIAASALGIYGSATALSPVTG